MEKRAKSIVYILSFITIGYGVTNLIKFVPSLRYLFIYNNHIYKSFSQFLVTTALYLAFTLIIPIAATIGGVLLFQLRELGRRLLIDISIVLYAFGFVAAIMNARWAFVLPENQAREILESLKSVGSVIVMAESLWPTYIVSLVAIIIIFYLTRPKVKEQFN